MKAHVIENGVVINTVVVDSLDAMANLVEATNGSIGWHYVNGVFTNPNAETEEERAVRVASSNRSKRNYLLSDSDWTQVADAPVDATAWATYRQALRDITGHVNFPYLTDEDWPVAP